VAAGGRHAKRPHEAWIAADPYKGGFCVLMTITITAPQGLERSAIFAIDEDPAVIAEGVRKTWKSRAFTHGRCTHEPIDLGCRDADPI
jgi:hypothetical protein